MHWRSVGIAPPGTYRTAGFGRAFWSKALYAKGYTLNAALVTAGALLLACRIAGLAERYLVQPGGSLADRLARNTATHTTEEIAAEIAELIKGRAT